jgi:hypothetical protein
MTKNTLKALGQPAITLRNALKVHPHGILPKAATPFDAPGLMKGHCRHKPPTHIAKSQKGRAKSKIICYTIGVIVLYAILTLRDQAQQNTHSPHARL